MEHECDNQTTDAEQFCKWYNEKYNSDMTPDTIEYELSAVEADILWQKFEDWREVRC